MLFITLGSHFKISFSLYYFSFELLAELALYIPIRLYSLSYKSCVLFEDSNETAKASSEIANSIFNIAAFLSFSLIVCINSTVGIALLSVFANLFYNIYI